ncbi:MAG: META domain-containing protein [Plesiomonas sp.]|uniref:META domain-containing protein n=1 Tax=Plesiomonas sp. TaxID=2486279 RepID=UPI003F3CA98A
MTLLNTLSLSLLCFSLLGCVSTPYASADNELTNPLSEPSVVSLADLAHHHFVLLRVDGKSWQPSAPQLHAQAMYPGIDFNEQNILSSTFCNTLQGHVSQIDKTIQGILIPINGSLPTKKTISTKKCSDKQLNQWDTLFQQMIKAGVTLKQQDTTLFIEGSGHTMVFMLRDWVY